MFLRVIKVFLLALLLSVFCFAAFLYGYKEGFEEGKNTQLFMEIPKPTFSPTPKPTQSPSAKIKQTPPQPKKITWGGPELWEAVNKRRMESGVNPLGKKDELCTLAAIRLNEIRQLGKLDNHEGFSTLSSRRPDLKWIFDKYNLGEFLIVGYETPQETVYAWEHTLGHKSLVAGGEWVWGCIYSQDTFGVAITAY